jgi:tRNA (guanine-N7-)-methyltransferase
MGKNKLFRFAENETFGHVVQPTFEEISSGHFPLKGHWNRDFFRREAPIVLELGCGKGEYTTGLARLHPQHNHLGVDIKGARLWRGARTIQDEGIQHTGFLRTHVDHIAACFGEGEVSVIWLTFSDPQLKKSKARKRLTSPLFLARYQQILGPGGVVNLKTDSPVLYEYTLEQIERFKLPLEEKSDDVYGELVPRSSPDMQAVFNIRTYYESMWLEEGRRIHYVRFGIGDGKTVFRLRDRVEEEEGNELTDREP